MRPYSKTQIILHWAVALLLGLQFLQSDYIGAAWRAARRGQEVAFDPLVLLHVAGGVLVLLLVLWRMMIAMRKDPVPDVTGTTPMMAFASKATHWALYGVVVLTVMSGLGAWFGMIELAGDVHEILTSAIIALVGLHVAAALYHQFYLKDGLMLRMSPRK